MSRPISTGTGVRLSVYVPRDLWDRFDGVVQRMFAAPVVSRCVQDALLMYVEDLEAKERQGHEIDKMGVYECRRLFTGEGVDRNG